MSGGSSAMAPATARGAKWPGCQQTDRDCEIELDFGSTQVDHNMRGPAPAAAFGGQPRPYLSLPNPRPGAPAPAEVLASRGVVESWQVASCRSYLCSREGGPHTSPTPETS